METARLMCALKGLFAPHRSLSIAFGCMFLISVSIQPIALHAQTYTDLHDLTYNTDGANPEGIVSQGRDGNLYGTLPQGGSSGYGTVYKITPSGTLSVIYTFSGLDGAYPYSGLTLGADGNFYGAAQQGGAYGFGTIFKITPNGTLTTLHNFTGTNGDGEAPLSPPVLGKKGLYGVTEGGIFPYMITSSGSYKLLPHQVPGESSAPLLLASDGNLYGTTYYGGNPGNGTVFKLSSSGAVTIIYNFDNEFGAFPNAGLAEGSDGNLYGTTTQGGTAANPAGTIFKMTLKGSITVLKNFDSQSSDGAYPFAGLVAGTDGNFYGAAQSSSGAPYGTLFKITKSGTFSVVNTFDSSHGADDLASPVQHTNGILYGETQQGGANNYGVFWSLNAGITPFVSIIGFPAATSGITVEILGQGFNSASSVKFGSGSASFKVVDDTYLTATVPDSGTSGTVTVTTNAGTLKSAQIFKVLPVLTSFIPTSGPVGTQVTVTGSGLTGAKSVTFNGVKATYTVNNADTITTTVPTGATTGKIKITTPGGTSTSKGSFTVN